MKQVIVLLISLCTIVAQTAAVSLSKTISDINQLSINDFDLSGKGSAPAFFGATIKISGATGEGVTAIFSVQVLRDDVPLFTSTSKPLEHIADDDQSWKSSDLGATINWPVSKDGKEKKVKLAFKTTNPSGLSKTTSSLPDGSYDVKLTVSLNGDEQVATLHLGDIINDYGLTLDAPGDGDEINTNLPTFRWSSVQDLSKIPGFTLYIYEVKNGESDAASMGRSPILKEAFTASNTKFFTFPASNNIPLEKGKSYIWTIKSKINVLTGSGSSIKEEASSISKFTYPADPVQEVVKEAFKTLELTGLAETMGPNFSKVTELTKNYRLKSANANGKSLDKAGANNLIQSFIPHIDKGAKNFILDGETKIGENVKVFSEAEIVKPIDGRQENPYSYFYETYFSTGWMGITPSNEYIRGINPYDDDIAEREKWEKEENLLSENAEKEYQKELADYNLRKEKYENEEKLRKDAYEKRKKENEDKRIKWDNDQKELKDNYNRQVTEREKRKSDWENYNKNMQTSGPQIDLIFEDESGDTKTIKMSITKVN
jgi:hypothetical protein